MNPQYSLIPLSEGVKRWQTRYTSPPFRQVNFFDCFIIGWSRVRAQPGPPTLFQDQWAGYPAHPARGSPSPCGTETMLTARKLERFLEIEENLRTEYQGKIEGFQGQIESKSAELARCQQELATQRQQMQATVDRQLETIAELSAKATTNQHTEQLNRELTNRSENLAEDLATLKKRAKTLQKDLTEAREEIKVLTQYDPVRMKKNLEASKKKLAEQTSANELLQKSLGKTRAENAELQRKVKELESKQADAAEPAAEEAAETETAEAPVTP